MKYLISGSATPFYESGEFIQYIKDAGAKRIAVMCEHHSKGGNHGWDKLIDKTKWQENEIEFTLADYKFFEEDDLNNYDGLYITGGLLDPLLVFMYEMKAYDKVRNFIANPDKFFISASAGTLILGRKFHTEPESDVIHMSRFCDEGFGFFPEILFEVHFDERNDTQFIENRIKETLKSNVDLKRAYALESDCCLKFRDFAHFDFEVVKGKYHVYESGR